MTPTTDTPNRIACLTPPGQAAIAVLGLHGPGAWDAARALFRPRAGTLPEAPTPGTFRLGRLGDPEAGPASVADEVVLAVLAAEPVPTLEVHCHGGRAAVAFVLELFAARGFRPCGWTEWLRHAGADPLRAAAAAALAEAATVRTASILLDQHEGALGRAVADALTALARGDRDGARRLLADLARWADLGRHLTRPWRVVLVGAPNVGKSSLLNALAGFQRSVVAATPGTTRDVVTARLAVDGWPVEVADTAGQRPGGDALEAAGAERARRQMRDADLCLWVLDAADAAVYPEPGEGRLQFVVNKIDRAPAWDLSAVADAPRVSARTGAGLPELCERLASWLVPQAPPPGTPVPFTAEQCAALEGAARCLEEDADAAAVRRLLTPMLADGA